LYDVLSLNPRVYFAGVLPPAYVFPQVNKRLLEHLHGVCSAFFLLDSSLHPLAFPPVRPRELFLFHSFCLLLSYHEPLMVRTWRFPFDARFFFFCFLRVFVPVLGRFFSWLFWSPTAVVQKDPASLALSNFFCPLGATAGGDVTRRFPGKFFFSVELVWSFGFVAGSFFSLSLWVGPPLPTCGQTFFLPTCFLPCLASGAF